ncbi:MAG: hypothetical protein R3B45_08525 [Bdellovibrionota bacterium]
MNLKEQILVIDPASHTPELDCFNHIACNSKLPCSYHLPALLSMRSLHSIDPSLVKGIIVFGSATSVHDNIKWQDNFASWLFEEMLRGVPTLGLCYGHQLIAHVFGGEVGFFNVQKDKLKGFRKVEFEEDPRLNLTKSTGMSVVSHNEIVKKLHGELECWGSSELISFEAIRHKILPVWSAQAHLEATHEFLFNQGIQCLDKNMNFSFGHSIILSFLRFCKSQK